MFLTSSSTAPPFSPWWRSLVTFENVRESVAVGLDFYLKKSNFKQGAFKRRVGRYTSCQNFRQSSHVTVA
jgi:hypothetical protein